MNHTITRPTRARRTALGLATLAVAASAITLPLVAQPAPAQAAAGGCTAGYATLQIQKTDPDGQPLEGAVFQVDAQHAVNSPFGENFAQNPLVDEYNAAMAASGQALATADAARTVLQAAQAAQADAQAALDELLAETGSQTPELEALYAQESEQSVALAAAQEALAQAEEALIAAEWGGAADEIAEAQAAVDAAQQIVDDALAALVDTRANITELEATGPSAEEIAEARAALEAAIEAAKQATADYEAADETSAAASRQSSALLLGAYEQVTPATVTTDEAGQATVEVVRYARCNPNSLPEGVRNSAEIISPVVTEIEAPSGFVRDSAPHAATWEGSEDDGGWTVTVVNSPEEPEGPEEPEDPVTPVEPPKPGVPLVQTGSDLTGPIVGFSAILAAAGAALASGPLLRRIRVKRS